jgi:hypothetical protein
MGEEVYVGIDVSKTELVVGVRPSGQSFTLTYDRVGLKHLVGRLGKLQPTGSTIARASSGSRSRISSVEPLMSANSAVTVLRSPSIVVETTEEPSS